MFAIAITQKKLDLHSTMVRLKPENVIYMRSCMLCYLHSTMVRLKLPKELFQSSYFEIIYIPLWLD